jgi:hypothetical protein
MARHAAAIVAAILLCAPAWAQADRTAYVKWLADAPGRNDEVQAFENYLTRADVSNVLTSDQLLLNATNWKRCSLKYPYSMPPRPLWGHIVPTLRFVRDEVVPLIGPVGVESGYREPALNRCAHGAPKSAHAEFYALDLIPERAMPQKNLIAAICKLHRERGKTYKFGLGFYGGLRFHVDTKAYRRWGSDNHGATSPCTSF